MPYCNFTIPLQTVIVQLRKKAEVSVVQVSERTCVFMAQGSCVLDLM